MNCRRPGITLFSGEAAYSGRSMSGIYLNKNVLTNSAEEYYELKDFINENFMKPLQKRNMKVVKLNAFNFDYLIKKLQNFSLMYKDAEIFL